VLHFARWKTLLITASVVLAALLCLPNVLSTQQQETLRGYGLRPMTLGLDLQGGASVLLEVDREALVTQVVQQQFADVRSALNEAKIGGEERQIQRDTDGVTVKILKPEDVEAARTALQALLLPQQGSALAGGTPVNLFDLNQTADGFTLKISEGGLQARIVAAIQQSLKILAYRADPTGTKEIPMQQQGFNRISVQLPGADNADEFVEAANRAGKLMFHLLCEQQPQGGATAPPPSCKSVPFKEGVDAALASKVANEPDEKKKSSVALTVAELKALPQMWVQTSTRATVDGADLTDAQASFGQNNNPVVTFRFNQRGALRFAKLTTENVNKPFAIVLDDVVQSYPEINEAITQGSGQISGNFTPEETNKQAIILRSGALPAKLNIVESRSVGPSLGADSVRAGFIACVIGLVGVMAFMFLPYGFFGFVANIALISNLLLLIACMSFFGFTLTLPGIAGILLTLGMAVDSNVLIYERIREEWRNGRTALSSIETGFRSALGTVLDANITTLIAAVVLFGVGSGPVRGFAVTLAIGIFTTMFTAFTVTRMIVAIWVKRSRPKEIHL
jgi:protein-export membrane protein SecD